MDVISHFSCAGVGKSAIVWRLMQGAAAEFATYQAVTQVGNDIQKATLTVSGGREIPLKVRTNSACIGTCVPVPVKLSLRSHSICRIVAAHRHRRHGAVCSGHQ